MLRSNLREKIMFRAKAKIMNKFYKELVNTYKKELQGFSNFIKKVPYEVKGIPHSEIFFIYCQLKKSPPSRIIESGRARGQSTLTLSKLFPKTQIISIELDEESRDTKIANQRLKNLKNVSCLYGDSKKLLPQLCKDGVNDVVLIDGPKGFKAIRLALNILKYKNVSKVFMHDNTHGTQERIFLEKYLPEASYSDHQILSKIANKLDQPFKSQLPKIYSYTPNNPYGCSVTLIENNKKYFVIFLILKTRILDLMSVLSRRFKFIKISRSIFSRL